MTYWPGVLILGFISNSLINQINALYLEPTLSDAAAEGIHIAIVVFIAVAQALLLRAVWLAANNDRSPGFWGWTGCVLIALGLSFILYALFTILVPGAPVPRSWLEDDVKSLQASLPAQIEEGLVLREVTLEDDTLTYFYFVNYPVPEEDISYYAMDNWQTVEEDTQNCKDMAGYFRSGLRVIAHVWEFENQTVRGEMIGEDCLAFLANR